MAKILLKDAFYTPFDDAFADQSITQYKQKIQTVIEAHCAAIGENQAHHYGDASHHYFCSTMMDSVFSAGSINSAEVFQSQYEVPQSFSNAYECACWGYLLRYHVTHKPQQRFLAISILDVNAMEMKYWSENEQWGKSGFGICTLFFEVCDAQAQELLHNGVASGGNNIISFASFAKQVAKKCSSSTLSLPFFPDSMSIPVRRSLKDLTVLTERHSYYGHAFGSDPWIAFIRDHQLQSLSGQNILFGSLALRGYYCFADITIPSNVNAHHFQQQA